jgi:hypothetical protein
MEIGTRNVFFLLAALFLIVVLMSSRSEITFAYTDFNVTVDVSIASISEITVTPAILNWSDIVPGLAGGTKTVDVKNTGSTNITNLYAFMSTITNESTRPYGSSNPDVYSAGGVVVFRNESETTYWWAGRLEWNWTEIISNTDRSAVTIASRASEGFFRNASVSYYWTAGNGTNTSGSLGCNNTGAIFAIEDQYDNGTTTTRTPDAGSITRNGGDENFSYFSISRAGNFMNSGCVAVSSNCDKIYMYRFDKRATGFNGNACTNAAFINAGPLAPNDIENLISDVWIPKGLPAGNLRRATWTFVAA